MAFLKSKDKNKTKKRTWISGSQLRKRSLAITLCFTLLLTALGIRVGYLQFVEGAKYQQMATEQQTKTRVITAKRGTIYDRNGNTLAVSATVYRVTINPRDIKNDENHPNVEEHQKYVAQKLAEILELDYQEVYKKVMATNAYQEIKRKVEDDVIDVLQAWMDSEKIFGVYIDEDAKRYYPNNSLAAHIIGFTGTDDQGLSGIEAIYDDYLTGTDGYILSAVDAKQNALPLGEETRVEPENGNDITLTIDETIQYLVEKSIAQTVEDCDVQEGAACIVMDPYTAEILAIASNPTFNLNDPFAFPTGHALTVEGYTEETWTGKTQAEVEILNSTVWRSKAISDTYEPGSTFKSISAAIFLEEGIVTKNSIVDDTPISVLGSSPIRCWLRSNTSNHGQETFEKAVWNSCNPVFAKMALKTGVTTYYNYVEAFGFKSKTGINFPGEGTSIFHTNPTELDMAVTSFGQRFQVTPLQMATAYCALANGGQLLVPQLVKTVTDGNGNILEKSEKEVVRQVISEETSQTVVDILEGVVSEGTGSNAYIKGLRIAGKTGTSETLTTEIDGRYVASFIGIAPADDPEIVLVYIMDHPNVGETYNGGGHVCAPPAGKLIEEILNYLKVERIYSDDDASEVKKTTSVPNLEGKTVAEATSLLSGQKLNIKVVGEAADDSQIVVSQMPASGYLIPEDSTVVVYTSNGEPETVIVPDLTGLSVNAALKKLNEFNLCMKIYGKGTVMSQEPAAGTEVPIGTIITVDFRTFYAGAE